MRERGIPEEVVQDIGSHCDPMGIPRDTDLRRALNAVDELCGFIIACALVKPDRSLGAVSAASAAARQMAFFIFPPVVRVRRGPLYPGPRGFQIERGVAGSANGEVAKCPI